MSIDKFPKLGPIVIGTSNIQVAKDFYINVFGITITDESKNYVSAHCIDGTHIELEEDSENRFPNWAKNNIGTYKNCEFFVSDINSFLEIVEKYGGNVVSKPIMRPWGNLCAEFSDPDSNIFLISQK